MSSHGLFSWPLLVALIRQSIARLSLDWAVDAQPCTPEEVLRALDCFRWVQRKTPITALWYMCEHPMPRSLRLHNISATAKPDIVKLCCRCFAKLAQIDRKLAQESAVFKTQLLVNRDAIVNISVQLSSPFTLRSPATHDAVRFATARFKTALGHFIEDAWLLSTSLLASVEDDAVYDLRTLESLVGDTLILARIRAEELQKLLLQTKNNCLPNIFKQKCTADHLPAFHSFPPVEGPERQGHAVDFLGCRVQKW